MNFRVSPRAFVAKNSKDTLDIYIYAAPSDALTFHRGNHDSQRLTILYIMEEQHRDLKQEQTIITR